VGVCVVVVVVVFVYWAVLKDVGGVLGGGSGCVLSVELVLFMFWRRLVCWGGFKVELCT